MDNKELNDVHNPEWKCDTCQVEMDDKDVIRINEEMYCPVCDDCMLVRNENK